MKYLYGLRLSSNEASIFYISTVASFVCAIFFSDRTKKGLAPMVPTFSHTEVVAEPAYAKLRQIETPEL